MGNKRFWDADMILSAFYGMKELLGRVPTSTEINGGARNALFKGNYDAEIRTYNGFLESIGEEVNLKMNIRNKEAILAYFYDAKKRLGRIPKLNEINFSVVRAIKKGNYDAEIRTYNGFLESIGEEVNKKHKFFDRDMILSAFYGMKELLGRVPTSTEISSGIIKSIQSGNYDAEIRTYNGFLRDNQEVIRHDTKKLTPVIFDAFYDDLKEKLGRVPTQQDWTDNGQGGVYQKLVTGKIFEKNKTYSEYVKSRGDKPNRDTKARDIDSIGILEALLED